MTSETKEIVKTAELDEMMPKRLIDSELAARLEDGPVLSAKCKREVADSVLHILRSVGEDPERDGLNRTPERVARMYDEILLGYTVDPVTLLNNALFDVEYDEMVIVNDIEFYSMCEHHLLPIVGRANVAYLPDKQVVGLSKLPRVVEAFARRLQVQERMTQQIAEFINDLVKPKGVGIVVDAAHMCVMMRGVKKAHARMRTTALLGSFRKDPRTRAEFMDSISPPGADSHFG
ncbi:MAG: GTP cyclohydrolase I FolE [Anaerolineae bacterium]